MVSSDIEIIEGRLRDASVIALLATHVTRARAETAQGSAHALDVSALEKTDMRFWSVWHGDTLHGVGALKILSADHGEIKSMHVAEAARRLGTGSAILTHIIAEALRQGLSRLSLETGSWDYFAPARALYRKHGFMDCRPFADYRPDPNSAFMTLYLHHKSA